MPELSKKDKLRLLEIMLESRHADLREQNLNRQGKGHFHTPGMGHEALAAISIQMDPDDYIVPFYRDRGLVLGRGMTTKQLALEYFAKRNTGSGGRMMASHYSDTDLHIWSVPTPTGAQLLPMRNCLGHSVGWKEKCRRHHSRRRGNASGRFFRSGLFRQRKKAAGPVHCGRQRLRHQHSDPGNKSARARRS